MKVCLKIGEVAKAASINIQTIRYYEKLGLIKPSSRRTSGYREYTDQAVTQLTFIKKAQELGFTLGDISELLKLRVSSTARCGDVKTKTEIKLADIKRKISSLQKMKRALEDLVHCCEEEKKTDECPILNSLR